MEEDKCEESCLEILKKDYSVLRERHNLPSFDELNKEFQIEKISEFETDFLIKEVRKFVVDKLTNYMNFIEAVLNPTNATIFIFSIIKALMVKEKEKLIEVYKKLSKNRIEAVILDVEYSEENEASYIKESYKLWEDVRKDIFNVLKIVSDNWDNKIEFNGRGYFG